MTPPWVRDKLDDEARRAAKRGLSVAEARRQDRVAIEQLLRDHPRAGQHCDGDHTFGACDRDGCDFVRLPF